MKSIAFIFLVLSLFYIVYKINNKKLTKLRFIRYLKVLVNIKSVLLIIIFSVISFCYILYLNNRYNSFYKNPPDEIKAKAIVIRRCCRKRI